MGRRPRVPYVPWCYPYTGDFECPACGALPGEDCDDAPLYGRRVHVSSADGRSGWVHVPRFHVRGEEVLRRLAAWKAEHGYTD